MEKTGFQTRSIHVGQAPDPSTGAIMVPITLATTYVQSSPGVFKGYDYSRADNPTRFAYEQCVASLEGADFGYAFASGCAAMTTVLHLLKKGDHVVSSDDVYGGTQRLFNQVIAHNGIDFTYADLRDVRNFEAALRPETKMLWIETPTNPLLRLADISALAGIARKRGIMVVVDNTFMSPYFQKPLDLGADLSLHSSTKYLNGHSDVIGGVVMSRRKDLAERLKFLQKSIGAVPSPFDCYLVMRSLKTLALRMREHEKNALAIARFLESHPKVESVIYPGLESHPQHALAKAQMSGFGGMISFRVKGDLEQARKLLERVQIFALAESLGGVESLIEHPAIMTHASVPAGVREKLGISDTLIRISVGVEDLDDLRRDLDQALK